MSKKVKTSPFLGFDHVHFYVSNAFQAASYYVSRLGFKPYAYKGLETGSRDIVTHVVQKNDIIIALSSALNPEGATSQEFGSLLARHGDGVRDVAFTVSDCRSLFKKAVERGATPGQEPTEYKDENGVVVIASVKAFDDTVHSFVERRNFNGHFLPNFRATDSDDPLNSLLPDTGLDFVDHVVTNHADGGMTPLVQWYEKILGLHQFWSVDETILHTEYSSLRSTVMTDDSEVIKLPINEPAPGKRKSQIQEFVDYYGGSGVQHIALNTQDVIQSVTALRKRGMQFLKIPKSYYKLLRERLAQSKVNVKEDLDVIESLNILVDFDDNGYLLQIFTKPVEDRPTVFYEIIQRNNHNGFGAGNFKSLFESIELEQQERGNLTETKN